jgi:hypothetical protein
MPQSNVIFFYVFAAFFVFITLRGELPKYLGFLLASPLPAGTTTLNGPGNIQASSLAPIAQTAAAFLG